MTATLWIYWEGNRSPIIDLCIQSVQRHNPTTRVVGPEEVRELGGGVLLDKLADLEVQFRSDVLRLWLLHQFGGVWVDADSIAVAPLDLAEVAADRDLVGEYNPHQKTGFGVNGLLATPFGARAGSPLMEAALSDIRMMLAQMRGGERVPYGQTSVGLLSMLWKTQRNLHRCERRQHWRYNPIPWQKARGEFFRRAKPHRHEASPFWSPTVQLYHLTNVVPKPLVEATEEEVLDSTAFYSFILKKAFGQSPAIFGRSEEVLRRLPPDRPVCGAEIGVFRGMNARHLLQQRRDLHLHLVDPWRVSDANYQQTGDHQTKWCKKKWEAAYRQAMQRVAFAEPRVTVIRERSQQAAAHVPDRSLDFVFIDANHSYEGCRSDIQAWACKIRPGGFIGGHDYGHPKEGTRYGVKRAVDHWCRTQGLDVETGKDWTWFVTLPRQSTAPVADA